MGNWDDWALTLSVLIPLVGAVVIAVLPSAAEQAAKGLAVAFSAATFAVTLGILFTYEYGAQAAAESQYQFEVTRSWITAVDSNYHLGIDGIALPMVVLTGLLTFLCAVYSTKIIPAPGKAKALLSLMLLLEVGMMGTFISLDLILFFVFWEIVLVPMYFMIAIWGGPNRSYASVKFFLYTLFGSAFMLLSFLALYFNVEPHTFDMVALANAAGGGTSRNFQYLAYLGLFLGFAIKVPMWPFHTWLPDAHTEAPTIGSVLLAGIMLKMGTYGFIRIANPMLPDGARAFAPYIGILATIAIIYGALCCLAQREAKRLIAFSSVGHMGFVMLGLATLTPTGTSAAVFGMVAHGVITGMLFFIVGSVKERYHTGEIAEIGGGMLVKMPYMGSLFTYVAIASLGLPGLAGFWGEIFALLAAFEPAEGLNVALFRGLMVGGAVGTIVTAGYFLWLLQRINLGVVPERWRGERFTDVMGIELAAWAPLLVLILALGVYPRFIFGMTDVAVEAVLAPFKG